MLHRYSSLPMLMSQEEITAKTSEILNLTPTNDALSPIEVVESLIEMLSRQTSLC